ncbi:hypothetical protein L1049_006065 [Liquidambar formosana]|uniref:Uncharacterized protein n=1 Tax=Liquidambar formosana TaxID=63359 RepID=A0AAP0REV7_LIQFO
MPIVAKRFSRSNEEEIGLRRGPWTLEEDTQLIHYIACHGEGRWNMLAKCAGLKRTGKSCRLRWLNYLKPDIKRGNLTPQEQLLILELHSKWGNRWSKIAQHLPGRTDNEIKNYWRTRVQKQARQLNIESNSKRFLDAVRCFWMPRLLQKMEQTTTAATAAAAVDTAIMNSQNSTVPSMPSPSPSPNKMLHNPNHPTEISSCVTSPNTSSNSMKISQPPEISEDQKSPPAFGNTFYNNPFLNDNCYYLDSGIYDLEDMTQPPMSATRTNDDFTLSDCQMAESHWVGNEVADTLWNIDELWQFR